MNFADYWNAVDEELARYPARPVLDEVASRSTDFATAYDVHLSSLGAYRIFGFLSVPRGDGPFPALLETPRYGSVNKPPAYRDRMRYVVFTVMHRGQRLADSPFQAEYPGLFTQGIDDPATYVYRSIVADCLRGAEFLLGLPSVDRSRVGIVGDDLALITAARRPAFAAVRSGGSVTAPAERVPDTEAARHTLSFFDADRHAASITAPTLRVGRDFVPTHEDAADDTALDAWLAERLGVQPLALFGLR
jgi:hypothetical protein